MSRILFTGGVRGSGGVSGPRRCLVPGGGLLPGGSGPGGCGEPPPVMATAAGGTHPTAMHSCYHLCTGIDNNFSHISVCVCLNCNFVQK